jgi:ERF superfamily
MEDNKDILKQLKEQSDLIRGIQSSIQSLTDKLDSRLLPNDQKTASRPEYCSETKKTEYCSEEISLVATALAKAQSVMPIAGLNADNPYFKSKYSNLAEIVRSSRAPLSSNGLSFTQIPLEDDNGLFLITRVLHTSGQWIESKVRIKPPKNDVQSFGSTLTYNKRQVLAAMIGMASGDEDDDGEISVADSREKSDKGTALNNRYNPRENSGETITKEQLEEIEYELTGYDDVYEKILESLHLRHMADMPKQRYRYAIDRIREIKLARSGSK